MATVPAAIVGSIALTLGATPAGAVEREVLIGDAHANAPKGLGFRADAAAPRSLGARPHAAFASRPVTAQAPASYVVVAGDTVFGIAQRFGLRTADVLAWNGLTAASVIHPGQTLTLAGAAAAAPAPAPPAPAPAPAPSTVRHTIAPGETISSIAKTYGFSVPAVLAANGLSWSSIIYPGQTITLPGAGSAPVAPPAAAPAPVPAPPAASASTHTVGKGDTISAIAKKYGFTTQDVLAANGLTPASIIYPGQTISLPVVFVPAVSTAPAPLAPQSAVLDAEQAANARLIIGIGRQLGVTDRGIAIALATAMVESWMRNLDWGDRDSLGLFQQRPSTGWGTEAEVSDATRATMAFYGGPTDPNGPRTRGLLDIPGWQDMGFSQAAQAVQISAYPERYGAWEAASYQWLAALG